jgi:hypothetical protein
METESSRAMSNAAMASDASLLSVESLLSAKKNRGLSEWKYIER